LELDFTDLEGNTLDTVVLAGVNGCGKTSILDLLEAIFSVEVVEPSDEIMNIYGAIEAAIDYNPNSPINSPIYYPDAYITYKIGNELIESCSKLIIYIEGIVHVTHCCDDR